MSIKFAGINELQGDFYILNFVVEEENETIICQGIEELMCTVLSAEEFDNWLGGEGLPLLNGEKINDEVEYAEKYIDKTADDYSVLFQD